MRRAEAQLKSVSVLEDVANDAARVEDAAEEAAESVILTRVIDLLDSTANMTDEGFFSLVPTITV